MIRDAEEMQSVKTARKSYLWRKIGAFTWGFNTAHYSLWGSSALLEHFTSVDVQPSIRTSVEIGAGLLLGKLLKDQVQYHDPLAIDEHLQIFEDMTERLEV
jgi:hypothetical protein